MNFDKIKDAVNSIEMSQTMKNRIIDNCNIIHKKKIFYFNPRRLVTVISIVAVLLTAIVVLPLNKNIPTANFQIIAYAMDVDGNKQSIELSSERTTFELWNKDRIGLINSIGGKENNLIFTDFILNINGEDIQSITYTMKKGIFIEDIILSSEEYRDRDWILSENISIIYSEPDSQIYHGIKEIGNTYKTMYDEQDQYEYTIAIPHDGDYSIDKDIVINVKVEYIDGNIEQQDIFVTKKTDSTVLELR